MQPAARLTQPGGPLLGKGNSRRPNAETTGGSPQSPWCYNQAPTNRRLVLKRSLFC